MILAAGLGTRLRPLSELRPKPALPVRGLPVVATLLRWLRVHGVEEVVVNAHHLPDALEAAALRHRPPGLAVRFSREERPLGTGGGIRRVARFLRESEPAVVVAGDGLLDLDLGTLVARHRERRDAATIVLRRDSRAAAFGTIGIDEEARVQRIGRRFDLGAESDAGVFVGVRLLAPRAFESLPRREVFEDLSDWLAPTLAPGGLRAEILAADASTWEPVGTPAEYLRANLRPTALSYMDVDAEAAAAGTRFLPELVIGAGARLGAGAHLERAVVWDGEEVPAGFRGSDGVFAGGAFHACAAAEREPS
jgi:mannose-1-phosphate guanylyltransferase